MFNPLNYLFLLCFFRSFFLSFSRITGKASNRSNRYEKSYGKRGKNRWIRCATYATRKWNKKIYIIHFTSNYLHVDGGKYSVGTCTRIRRERKRRAQCEHTHTYHTSIDIKELKYGSFTACFIRPFMHNNNFRLNFFYCAFAVAFCHILNAQPNECAWHRVVLVCI